MKTWQLVMKGEFRFLSLCSKAGHKWTQTEQMKKADMRGCAICKCVEIRK